MLFYEIQLMIQYILMKMKEIKICYISIIPLTIITIIVSLISIKGFPIALGALYLPVLFKVIQLQLNLSKDLIDNATAHPFIKSNQKGIMISVICILIVTGILAYTLNDFIEV